MAATRISPTAPLLTNTHTMHGLPTEKYHELLTNSRNGICMTKHELHQKDMIVSPLIEQGQSPYQISVNLPELDMSFRTIYTYIDKGLFSTRNVDLKRKPKFKPRK